MSSKLTPLDLETCFNVIREAMLSDPSYLWAWQCNLSTPIMDATGLLHDQANQAAALILAQLFKVDSTTCTEYTYPKSMAQIYFEARCEADSRNPDKPYDAYLPLKGPPDCHDEDDDPKQMEG